MSSIATQFKPGIEHPRWKKSGLSYMGVHKWLYRTFGVATKCEYKLCKYPRKNAAGTLIEKPRRFDWANLSGLYKRDRSDWVQLCPSDHAKFDRDLITL